jgi:predicted acylesterase/phospholipase RssA
MQRSKTALVLAGGGLAGAAYEIGALCAIDEVLEEPSVNAFDIYVGTSAGALVAACLASRFTPRAMLALLERSLLGIDQLEPGHLFSLNFQDIVRRSLQMPRALLRTGLGLARDWQTLSLLDIVSALAVGLPTGLYDTQALEHYLRESLARHGLSNRFSDLDCELAIIATDLDSGERAVFGTPPLEDVPISRAVCASAALPLFYRPVRIDGRDYIDGGLRGTASLDLAIERGAELIVCINPLVPYDNRLHRPGDGIGDQGLPQIGNQVFRTLIHSGLHYHLKQVRRKYPHVDILLIEPDRDDHTMFLEHTMHYETRMTLARHGFDSVTRQLNQRYDYFYTLLEGHGVRLRPVEVARALDDQSLRVEAPHDAFAAVQPVTAAHPASASLGQTLRELERLLGRIERRAV